MTEEINRFGGHVNLADGADELTNFQRGNDMSRSNSEINNENTLIVEKEGQVPVELEFTYFPYPSKCRI